MESEANTLRLSIKDLFTSKMIKYSILPFVVSILLLYTLFFVMAGAGLEQLGTMQIESTQTSIQNGIPHTDSFAATLEGTALVKFLMSHAITSWIATFLVYTIGTLLTLYFSIFVALIVIGFMTPFVLKELHKRHYSDVAMLGHSNIFEGLFLVFKWMFIMIFLFLAFIPLYFIPIVNIIAFNLPLYYFFHKMLTYDVASNICTKEENAKIKFFHASTLRLKTLALYLISLIPFVIFFASIFYVIYLGHAYFLEVRKMRATA
ncbi:EI24 domain-containing protein [bacterium]|nr:EI24 domain-containing protein [bacterium]MBU1435175.1 EI24 domain-containing protein [bacterium]MBU1502832.1 EI24 domain-containing protein [bacterium]